MKHRFLDVTFRNGRPLAAYLSLDRRPGDTSARSEPRPNGYVIDYAADGRVIGIEITAPSRFSVTELNELLAELSQAPVSPDEAAPLAA